MEWANTLIAALSGVLTLGVVYGSLRSHITQLSRDLIRLEDEVLSVRSLYVTLRHFEAVTSRIQTQQDEMQRDIKMILEHVSK